VEKYWRKGADVAQAVPVFDASLSLSLSTLASHRLQLLDENSFAVKLLSQGCVLCSVKDKNSLARKAAGVESAAREIIRRRKPKSFRVD